jgi:hypothetical protein
MIAWMHPALEFAPPRGSEIAKPHVHVFFLGLVALSLIGLFCSFGMAAWRFRVTAAVVLAVSTALWVSLALMGTGIAQFWHWIVFTVLWLVLPVAISLILFRPRARSTCHKRCWVTCLLTAIVALGFVSMNSRQLEILICRIPLAAENSLQDSNGLDPFRFDLMLWSLSGNPPHNLQETIQTAREALLRLEYFE